MRTSGYGGKYNRPLDSDPRAVRDECTRHECDDARVRLAEKFCPTVNAVTPDSLA